MRPIVLSLLAGALLGSCTHVAARNAGFTRWCQTDLECPAPQACVNRICALDEGAAQACTTQDDCPDHAPCEQGTCQNERKDRL